MELDGRELGHAADFMLGGLVSVYRTWVLKEDREPIECVSHRMEILLAGSLRALLEEAEARSGTAGGVRPHGAESPGALRCNGRVRRMEWDL